MQQQTTILSGRTLRDKLVTQVQHHAATLTQENITPTLAVVMVGNNPASAAYVHAKQALAITCGIQTRMYALAEATQTQVESLIADLNNDPAVHGILLQMPLPAPLDTATLLAMLNPLKDVDGLTPVNIGKLELGATDALLPCTPLGVMRLLQSITFPFKGAHAVVIGRSNLVGRPLASLLGHANATVTVCHRHTRDLRKHTLAADLVVVAAGNPGLIGCDDIKPGAVVVDVGINDIGETPGGKRRLVGDCDFTTCKQVASVITPVPGGVGPMTVASLMTNVIDATCIQNNLPRPDWQL